MPTFSAIALDRLLDPGAPKSLTTSKNREASDRSPIPSKTALPSDDFRLSSKRLDIPPSHPRRIRRTSLTELPENRVPALYATPESTPLPDSPTSFPPSSPYIINHKRRGPRLLKSFSEKNVAAVEKREDDAESKPVIRHSSSFSEDKISFELNDAVTNGDVRVENRSLNGEIDAQEVEIVVSSGKLGRENDDMNVVGLNSDRQGGETEDFFDPHESMTYGSCTDGEDYSVDRATKLGSSIGEFFDAAEELSSDSGRQSYRSLCDVEIELREMRLSLLMEIERRKQAEEALINMQSQWHVLRERLMSVGLILPADLSALLEDSQSDADPFEEIFRQIHLARVVSESIGRGIAKAEAEAEMESQLEVKNFEIARLADRLNYYEIMNREMSHRNQEAIEIARCERQKRKRRQKWVWGSIGTAIIIGSAALAWSYAPNGRGSSSSAFVDASKK